MTLVMWSSCACAFCLVFPSVASVRPSLTDNLVWPFWRMLLGTLQCDEGDASH